jgi:hypothetical protein
VQLPLMCGDGGGKHPGTHGSTPSSSSSSGGGSSSSGSPIAAFAHVLELDALFIALSSGQLLLLHTQHPALLSQQRQEQQQQQQRGAAAHGGRSSSAASGGAQRADGHAAPLWCGAGSEGVVEEVGVIEGGVEAAAWSPDGELLTVLARRSATLLLMNKARGALCGCGCVCGCVAVCVCVGVGGRVCAGVRARLCGVEL